MARSRLSNSIATEKDLPKVKITKETLKNSALLLSYLKPYWLKFSAGLFFLLLSTFAFMSIPGGLGKLIDAASNALSQNELGHINQITLGLMGVLVLQAFLSFFRIIWFVEVGEKIIAGIRKDTYFKLITLSMDFFSKRRVGELSSRISSDLSQIQDSITTTFSEFLRQIIVLVVGLILLFRYSTELTLLMLSIFPVLVLIAIFFGRFIRKISKQTQDKLADSNIIVEETLQGIANVKAFVNESFEALRYQKSIHEVVQITLKGAKYRGAFVVFITIGLFGSIVAVVWKGAHLVQSAALSMGDLSAFILLSGFLGGALAGFAELYTQLQKTLGATERVVELLKEQGEAISMHPSSKQIKNHLQGEITFQSVGFAYPTRKEITVLQAVSFRVKQGERLAIVGPSGAGKSTIVSLLLRFYQTSKGEILFDGKPAESYSLTDLRNQIGIVPQDVLLFGGTIAENIAYGKTGASTEEVMHAAKDANAHDFIMDFPEGYQTIVGERGIKLSGGQRQRIAIARALLKNPVILILDEATSSLDSESERLVQEALEKLMKHRTSIIVAHRLSTIREANKIIVLDKGKIVEQGTHQQLITMQGGLYQHLNYLQQEKKSN